MYVGSLDYNHQLFNVKHMKWDKMDEFNLINWLKIRWGVI